jgi:dienelactone hydrolase
MVHFPCDERRSSPARALQRVHRFAVPVLLAALLGSARGADFSSDTVRIPVEGAAARGMVTAVFRPTREEPLPIVIYSHGRAGTELERRAMKTLDANGHVRYWLGKGFAVVAPVRPGYGETGGADRESSGVRYDIFGNCWGPPDFDRAATAATRAIAATLAWLRDQPWADAGRIVLVGSSMGGLTSAAMAATNPVGVVGYINFAGGTGGDGRRSPQHSCGSDAMETLMGTYGRKTLVASLWLYAENDSYWGAEWPRAWHRAFAAGHSRTAFVMTDALPHADGHQLLARGSRLWTTYVDRFLQELGF